MPSKKETPPELSDEALMKLIQLSYASFEASQEGARRNLTLEEQYGFHDKKHPMCLPFWVLILLHLLPGIVSAPISYFVGQLAHVREWPVSISIAIGVTLLWTIPLEMAILVYVDKVTTGRLHFPPKLLKFIPYWPVLYDPKPEKPQPLSDGVTPTPQMLKLSRPMTTAFRRRRRAAEPPARTLVPATPEDVAATTATTSQARKPREPMSPFLRFFKRFLQPSNKRMGLSFLWGTVVMLLGQPVELLIWTRLAPAAFNENEHGIFTRFPFLPLAWSESTFDKETTNGLGLISVFFVLFVSGLAAAVLEEAFFRGLLLPALKQQSPRWLGSKGKYAFALHTLLVVASQVTTPFTFISRFVAMLPVYWLVQADGDLSPSLALNTMLTLIGIVAEFIHVFRS